MAKATQMRYKRTRSDKIFDFVNVTLLVIFTLIILYPVIFVVMASFSDPNKIYEVPLLLWPRGFNTRGYAAILQNKDILTGFWNALVYTLLGTFISTFVTILGSYPLSRKDMVGRQPLTMFYTFTMFFGGGLIPTYLVNQTLGIINTIWVMILPGAVGVWNMILMRTYYTSNIPNSLIESAYMDGANDLQLMFKIVLPLSTPIIAVTAMFTGVGRWNSYFDAMIYLQDRSKFPLQLILREILIQNQFGDKANATINSSLQTQLAALKQVMKYSVVIVSTVPVLVFYPMVSKYFEKGILVGSLKG